MSGVAGEGPFTAARARPSETRVLAKCYRGVPAVDGIDVAVGARIRFIEPASAVVDAQVLRDCT